MRPLNALPLVLIIALGFNLAESCKQDSKSELPPLNMNQIFSDLEKKQVVPNTFKRYKGDIILQRIGTTDFGVFLEGTPDHLFFVLQTASNATFENGILKNAEVIYSNEMLIVSSENESWLLGLESKLHPAERIKTLYRHEGFGFGQHTNAQFYIEVKQLMSGVEDRDGTINPPTEVSCKCNHPSANATCKSGGVGATSCSVSSGGKSCSVSCGSGTEACCNE